MKKRAQKILSVALSVFLILSVLSVIPFTASAETVSGSCGENVTWEYDTSTDTLTISGTGAMWGYPSSDAPWRSYYNAMKSVVINSGVTSIGYNAFYGCTGLTSVTIPDSVTSIGNYAFSYCTGLTSITIPDSVTSIDERAFYGCTGLKTAGPIGGGYNIEFGWSNKIPSSAFSSFTGLTSVTIPDSVTSIGGRAFYGCTGLTSITIPDSVTEIGRYAFYYCTGLTSVTIPDSVTSIGSDAFNDTAWYNHQPDGLVYAGKVAYKYKGACPSSVIIKDGTLGIAENAFYNCAGLTSVTIPDSVTTIDVSAFYGCTGLKTAGPIGGGYNIEFGWSEVIPQYAFYSFYNLTEITLPSAITRIEKYAFENCRTITDVYYAGSEGDRAKITIDNRHTGNDDLLYANWHYNSAIGAETCPHAKMKWITAYNSSLTQTGLRIRVCEICGKELESEEIPVLDQAAPRIEFDYDRAAIGGTVKVNIRIKNNPGITSLKLNVLFDSCFTLKSVTYNEEIGGISQQPYAPGIPVKLNWIDGLKNNSNDFLFATLELKIAKVAAPGAKLITADYDPEDIFNLSDQNIAFSVIDGAINVTEPTPGDVNDDGVLNNKDLTRLFQYLSDWPIEVNEAVLDINGDGSVNNKDLTRLFQYLSDWDVEIF